jgi:hypothetical protein
LLLSALDEISTILRDTVEQTKSTMLDSEGLLPVVQRTLKQASVCCSFPDILAGGRLAERQEAFWAAFELPPPHLFRHSLVLFVWASVVVCGEFLG